MVCHVTTPWTIVPVRTPFDEEEDEQPRQGSGDVLPANNNLSRGFGKLVRIRRQTDHEGTIPERRLIVGKRARVRVGLSGAAKHAVTGRHIPLHRGSQPGIDIGSTFGDHTKLQ